ncbi:hypothetical protein LTR22_013441 [Elasticomyces elasticus]|nr:hypothetical protein LTR22_013441 [Elasticomyces elasticus]KAK4916300.1 hypothetical protein LTR49_015672 [Elasticomyces elasticus]
MSREDHTCGPSHANQQRSCKACREVVLMEVDTSPLQRLPQAGQGRRLVDAVVDGHAQQLHPETDAWLADARGYPRSTDWWTIDISERAVHIAPTHSMDHFPYPLSIDIPPSPTLHRQANNQVFNRIGPNPYQQRGNEMPAGGRAQSLPQAWGQRMEPANASNGLARVNVAVRKVRRADTTDPATPKKHVR